MNTLENAMFLFESITCLCAEGPEFMGNLDLCKVIERDAARGFELCGEALKLERASGAQRCGACGGTGKARPVLDVEEFYKD